MNKLKFILIGKIKDTNLKQQIQDYILMLSKYSLVSLTFSEEKFIQDETNEKLIAKALEYEQTKVLKLINKDDYLITLDLHGKEFNNSIDFANKFKEIINNNTSITILIGSSYGISDKIRQRSNLLLKLSNLTFTHPLTLLITLEQIFRAYKIINNETYHK